MTTVTKRVLRKRKREPRKSKIVKKGNKGRLTDKEEVQNDDLSNEICSINNA